MSDEKHDPNETVYVRNEEGGIHSVTRAHFEKYLTQRTNAGRTFPLPGWAEITEAEAKKAAPQLFGKPDPRIIYTDDELIRAAQRAETLAKLRAAS